MRPIHEPSLGAVYLGDRRVRFRVWAPAAASVEVDLEAGPGSVSSHALEPEGNGYFSFAQSEICRAWSLRTRGSFG